MKLIATANTIELVANNEIIFIEACQNYSKFHLTNKRLMLSRDSLASLQKNIGENFFRVHHSYIVNLSNVKRYFRNGEVELQDSKIVPVSRRRRTEFVEQLEQIYALS